MDLLAAIRIYVRVVERGSMSAAARDLGIGQPAVSDRIERLERHLGAKLLNRNTRAIATTDVGALFYMRGKRVLQVADVAQACVVEDKQNLTGVVRIAAPHGLGEVMLLPVLRRLRENHPDLEVDLILNDNVVDPVREGVDMSLRVGPPGGGFVVAHPLGPVNRILVAAPSYLTRHGTPATPQELVEHPFVSVATQFCSNPLQLLSEQRETIRPPINVVWRISHWRPGLLLLLEGYGIGVLQAPLCAPSIESGQLTQILPTHSLASAEVHVLYAPIRPVPQKIRATLNLLDAHIKAHPM